MKNMNRPNHQSDKAQSSPPPVGSAPIVLDHLPSMPSLLGRAAFKSGYYQLGDVLPALSTEINHLRIRQADLRDYRALCGFTDNAVLPATYLHMLSFRCR